MRQLMDLSELADLLEVSPERAAALTESVVFPPCVGDRGAERLWRRDDVELWARAIGPDAARPEILAAREEVEFLGYED
jgi:hypothetical protein